MTSQPHPTLAEAAKAAEIKLRLRERINATRTRLDTLIEESRQRQQALEAARLAGQPCAYLEAQCKAVATQRRMAADAFHKATADDFVFWAAWRNVRADDRRTPQVESELAALFERWSRAEL